MGNSRGGAAVAATVLLIAVALAAGNLFFLARVGDAAAPLMDAVAGAYARQPQMVLYFTIAPLVAGVVIALLTASGGQPAAAPAEPPESAAPTATPQDGALRMLALLQQEGRLLDFLEEDIDAYSDGQVGAAVRSIHSGCRKALHDRMRIERIYAEEDGTAIEVAAGFDPAAVRLTGNVRGQPPFRGTLEHGGWRAADVKLPEPSAELDATILAPAEVEIG